MNVAAMRARFPGIVGWGARGIIGSGRPGPVGTVAVALTRGRAGRGGRCMRTEAERVPRDEEWNEEGNQ